MYEGDFVTIKILDYHIFEKFMSSGDIHSEA